MEILVNKEPIEFELKSEISLAEVLKHIEKWANKGDLFIVDYTVQPPEINGNKNISISSSDIERLEVQVGDRDALLFENLQQLSKYLDKVGTFIASQMQVEAEISEDEKKLLLDGLAWILESLATLIEQLKNVMTEDQLSQLTLAVEKIQNQEKFGDLAQLLNALSAIKVQAISWIKQCQYKGLSKEDLLELKDKFFKELAQQAITLEEIATNFTIGKDIEAFKSLEKIVEFLAEVVQICFLTETKKETSKKLIKTLGDLTAALDSRDMVTAADMIDYDLREIIEELLSK